MVSNAEKTVVLREAQVSILSLITGGPGSSVVRVRASEGPPEGQVDGSVGDLVVSAQPPALYEKLSGNRTNTGWSLVAGAGVDSTEVAASRAVGPADASRLLLVDSAAPVVVTLGDTPTDFWAEVVRFGAGAVTFAQGGTTPILSAGGALSISAQYAGATVTRLPDAWLVVGSLS